MSSDDITPAEMAYSAAEEMIAEAIKEGDIDLDFDNILTNNLEKIPPQLAQLTQLVLLNLTSTQISDLSPLTTLTNLQDLYLDHTLVSTLTPIRNSINLEALYFDDTSIDDLSPIMNMPRLRQLTFNRTEVDDLSQILQLQGLLKTGNTRFGLQFTDCTAATNDPKIAEISKIKDNTERVQALFAYLRSIEEKNIQPQSNLGLPYEVNADGQIAYQQVAPVTPDPALAEFHPVVVAECHALMSLCQSGRNIPYKPLGDTLERYHAALGNDAALINAAMTWKLGNDLRLTLKTNAERRKDDLDDMPPLGIDLRNMLDGLVQSHNVLCELHPRMKLLDTARIDTVDRHEANQSRDIVNAALAAFSEQVQLLRAEIITDLQDINREAQSDTQAALRAMKIEQESLENLVKAILVQGIRDSKDPSLMAKISGDMRGAAVGTVFAAGTTAMGPEIAATYPALVAQMQPYISALLSAMHGSDYPLADAVNYLTNKVRRNGEDDPPE